MASGPGVEWSIRVLLPAVVRLPAICPRGRCGAALRNLPFVDRPRPVEGYGRTSGSVLGQPEHSGCHLGRVSWFRAPERPTGRSIGAVGISRPAWAGGMGRVDLFGGDRRGWAGARLG